MRESGNIKKCFDEYFEDYVISDELRKVRSICSVNFFQAKYMWLCSLRRIILLKLHSHMYQLLTFAGYRRSKLSWHCLVRILKKISCSILYPTLVTEHLQKSGWNKTHACKLVSTDQEAGTIQAAVAVTDSTFHHDSYLLLGTDWNTLSWFQIICHCTWKLSAPVTYTINI